MLARLCRECHYVVTIIPALAIDRRGTGRRRALRMLETTLASQPT